LRVQMEQVKSIAHKAKFGGATGNFNAHYAAYPDYDWQKFANGFVRNFLDWNAPLLLLKLSTTTVLQHNATH